MRSTVAARRDSSHTLWLKPPLKGAARMSDSNIKFTEKEALDFHSQGRPGKIEIVASKPMATQRDLSLAYSPGVAVPVRAIAENPTCAYDYLSLIHISEPTRLLSISYAVFCLKKKI